MKRLTPVLFIGAVLGAAGLIRAYQAEPPVPIDPASLQKQLAENNPALQDWAVVGRYRRENAQIGAPAPGESRVVFMGDSITERWRKKSGEFFPGKPYFDRGISGQTTPQMLVRFRPDVLALNPKVVVILGGTNDLAGKTGPETLQDIEGYLAAMARLAADSQIRVVLASVLPVCGNRLATRPPAQILQLNEWMKSYCARTHAIYLDYYSALVDDNSMLKQEFSADCIHPNEAGYAVMKPLVESAIQDALAVK